MKLFSALLIGFTLSSSAFALDINEIAGQYKGKCSVTYSTYYTNGKVRDQYTEEQDAALYVGKYENVVGAIVDMAFSTEQTSTSGRIPNAYKFLLNADKEAEAFVAEIIKEGYTGTDNTLGFIDNIEGKYEYYSQKEDDTLKILTSKSNGCRPGIACNPVEIAQCRLVSVVATGVRGYVGCKRFFDVTVLRKLEGNKLETKRTAEQYGSLAFGDSKIFPEIKSTCVWEKQ